MPTRPRHRTSAGTDRDLLDRSVVLHALVLTIVMLLFTAVLWVHGNVGAVGGVTMMAATVPVAVGIALAFHWFEGGAARLFTHHLLAGGGDRRPPEYSLEDSYVARGLYDRAADAYLVRILAEPAEIDASFRLAEVHSRHRKDFASAADVLGDLRRQALDPEQERRVTRALVDLYETAGDRHSLRSELARLADLCRGTPAGRGALRRLSELDAG